jgi:predicted nucleotidyltransferase
MSRLHQLDPEQREEIVEKLIGRLGNERTVAYAYLHGSFLDQQKFHDIDLAVSFEPGSASHPLKLVELSESLTEAVGLPVDVRSLDEAPLAFRFHAFRGRLLLSRDDERLATTIEETTRRYLDLEPFLRAATREAFSA